MNEWMDDNSSCRIRCWMLTSRWFVFEMCTRWKRRNNVALEPFCKWKFQHLPHHFVLVRLLPPSLLLLFLLCQRFQLLLMFRLLLLWPLYAGIWYEFNDFVFPFPLKPICCWCWSGWWWCCCRRRVARFLTSKSSAISKPSSYSTRTISPHVFTSLEIGFDK